LASELVLGAGDEPAIAEAAVTPARSRCGGQGTGPGPAHDL